MENSEIRLILLDFDGTLADTRRANTLAYVAALGEAGYKLTEEEYAAHYFGMRCDEFLTRLGSPTPPNASGYGCVKSPSTLVFDTVRLNVPLWEFCRQFRADGGRVWVVSTGSRENIDNVIAHLGIGGGLDGILSGADVEHAKPAPDCFLEAMRRGLHAARDADLRGFADRHRGGAP